MANRSLEAKAARAKKQARAFGSMEGSKHDNLMMPSKAGLRAVATMASSNHLITRIKLPRKVAREVKQTAYREIHSVFQCFDLWADCDNELYVPTYHPARG